MIIVKKFLIQKEGGSRMKKFEKVLMYVNDTLYRPNELKVSSVQEEPQNSKYCGVKFKLNSKSIRFRLAHTTEKKAGQFVSFWEKDEKNRNQAYGFDRATDLLVINTFGKGDYFGQFVFPKEVLLDKGILKNGPIKGKMGMRVYPSWDEVTSDQARASQTWQGKFFIDFGEDKEILNKKVRELYSF